MFVCLWVRLHAWFIVRLLNAVATRAVESESRNDFQPEESELEKILTTPTPGWTFARRLWLFVPQTCLRVTLGNLSGLTFQQNRFVAIQNGCSALSLIPTLDFIFLYKVCPASMCWCWLTCPHSALHSRMQLEQVGGNSKIKTQCDLNPQVVVLLLLWHVSIKSMYRAAWTMHGNCLVAKDHPDLWFLVMLLLRYDALIIDPINWRQHSYFP